MPDQENPLISIIVPSYNQGAFIRQTIESCLEQNYRPIEIIVIDGASTDNTIDVLKSFGDIPELHWVSEPDDGVVDAVNKGVAKATGSVCAIQSSDDAYLPNVFQQVIQIFRQHPQAALVYADMVKTDADGKELSRFISGVFSITNFLSKRTFIPQPAAFFRREVFLELGGWSRNYFNADTECWLRMILRYKAVKVNSFWGLRRMHEGQRDCRSEQILESYRRMMLENPILQDGPILWRRAARCGIIRHSIRYGGLMSRTEKRKKLFNAVVLWPPILFDLDVGEILIPYYHALRRITGNLRSRLQCVRFFGGGR